VHSHTSSLTANNQRTDGAVKTTIRDDECLNIKAGNTCSNSVHKLGLVT